MSDSDKVIPEYTSADASTKSGEGGQNEPSRDKPARRRWPRLLAFFGLAILVLVGLAPNLIGWSGKLDQIANSFVELNGQIKIEKASLGWFQQLKLSGIQLENENGETIAKVDSLTSSKSLLNIALHQDEPGEFFIDGAEIALIVWPGGSNLETVLQPVLLPDEPEDEETPEPHELPKVTLKVANSSFSIREKDQQQWHDLKNTNILIDVVPAKSVVAFSIEADTGDTGTLRSSGDFEYMLTSDVPLIQLQSEIEIESLDCSIANAVLHRLDQNIQVSGVLDTQTKVGIARSGSDLSLIFNKFQLADVVVDAPDFLGSGPSKLNRMTVTGDLFCSQSQISSQQIALESDVATVNFSGSTDPIELLEAVSGKREIQNDFNLSGIVDLAKATQLAPALLNVRDDIELHEAKLAYEAFSRRENNQRRIFVNFELPMIIASQFESIQRGGKTIVDKNRGSEINWRQPIRITASGIQNNTPLWLELLTCESDFLTARGTTGVDGRGQLTITGNLARFKNRLGQFIDLSEIRLGGDISGQFDWNKLTAQQFSQFKSTNGITTQDSNMPVFQVIGGCTINDFLYKSGQEPAIREDSLVLKLGLNHAYRNQASRLETAAIEIQSAEDRVLANLLRPVRNPDFKSTYLLNVSAAGDLSKWLQRGRAFAWIPQMNLQGRLNAEATLECGPEAFSLKTKTFDAQEFYLAMQGMRIREPRVDADLNLSYDFATQQLNGKRLTIKTDASAIGCENLTVDLSTSQRSDQFINSHVAMILDIDEIATWFHEPQSGPNPYRGRLSGEADIAITGATVDMSLDSKIDQFAYLAFDETSRPANQQIRNPKPIWTEPTAKLVANAKYNFLNDSLGVKQLHVDSEGLSLDVRGRITDTTSICNLNLAGELRTDCEKLVRRLQENFGIDLQMRGIDQSGIVLKGPLFAPATAGSPQTTQPAILASNTDKARTPMDSAQTVDKPEQLNARLQIRWDDGKVYGLPFGGGRVKISYDPTQLDIAPINLALDRGRLNVDPAVRFNQPTVVTLASGKLINRANLSPEICRGWMTYVAPMLAEATEAEGIFSVDLNQDAVFPLTDPLAGSLDANITLFKADVGPGPLGQQVIAIAGKVRSVVKGEPLSALLVPQTGANGQQKRVWIRMPQQSVACRIDAGRVFHDKMVFQIGDVLVHTSGSVGADQSVDMVVSVPIQEEWLADRKLLRSLAGDAQVVQIPVRGTVTKPRFGTDGLADWSKHFVRGAAENFLQDRAGQFLEDSAGKLLKDGTGDLLKPKGSTNSDRPLRDAAGELLEDQLRQGLNRLIKPPNQK